MTATATAPTTDLSLIIPPEIKGEDTILQLRDAAAPFYTAALPLCEEARAIVVTDVADKKGMANARRVRLALKELRVDADKARKALKEESLRKGQAIDTIFNRYRDALAAHESYLEEQEKYAERVAEQERIRVKNERDARLIALGVDPAAYRTGDMTADAWSATVAGIEAQQAAARKAAEEADAARIAKEQEEAAERERVRVENERLKAEAEAVEKQRAAERAEAEKERKALEAKARAEAEAREKAERELKAKQEAEAKAERERKDAERKAAAAPDADKLRALAAQVRAIAMPTCVTPEAVAAVRRINSMIAELESAIAAEADRL